MVTRYQRCQFKNAIFVLVGNKIDLEDKRAVESKEAEDFANEKGFLFYEVSAKTGENVEDLFEKKIFPEMARKYNIGDEEEEGGEGGETAQNRNDGGIKLGNNNQAPKKKGGCCGGGKNKKASQQVESQGNEGNEGNEGTEGEGGTKESQGEE